MLEHNRGQWLLLQGTSSAITVVKLPCSPKEVDTGVHWFATHEELVTEELGSNCVRANAATS